MTPKEILNSFSDTLMQDERILTQRERELLTSLLQNGRTAANGNPQVRAAFDTTMNQALGETLGRRAFAVLGSCMVERILTSGAEDFNEIARTNVRNMSPEPPSGPQPPAGPHMIPRRPVPQPPTGPQPPAGPQPPSGPSPKPRQELSPTTVAVLEEPQHLPAICVVLDEFLAPQELDRLTGYALERESEFRTSKVISPAGDGTTNFNHRRSRVLLNLGGFKRLVEERIQNVLPRLFQKLGVDRFAPSLIEAQITASNDGDFFGAHSDNSDDAVSSRQLTFVYFFHREPQRFMGGELRIHDSHPSHAYHGSAGSYRTIEPQQNQIVFFPSSMWHEISPVKCPSQAFADSRFTLNGWLHN